MIRRVCTIVQGPVCRAAGRQLVRNQRYSRRCTCSGCRIDRMRAAPDVVTLDVCTRGAGAAPLRAILYSVFQYKGIASGLFSCRQMDRT